jgi:hypothetical protein
LKIYGSFGSDEGLLLARRDGVGQVTGYFGPQVLY